MLENEQLQQAVELGKLQEQSKTRGNVLIIQGITQLSEFMALLYNNQSHIPTSTFIYETAVITWGLNTTYEIINLFIQNRINSKVNKLKQSLNYQPEKPKRKSREKIKLGDDGEFLEDYVDPNNNISSYFHNHR
ncbi:MAG TPA: hypothetical protein VG895_04120 [Patescibacteria group bacterium]|nr:hypothetical protein [Patescibacteria group bacterium]